MINDPTSPKHDTNKLQVPEKSNWDGPPKTVVRPAIKIARSNKKNESVHEKMHEERKAQLRRKMRFKIRFYAAMVRASENIENHVYNSYFTLIIC